MAYLFMFTALVCFSLALLAGMLLKYPYEWSQFVDMPENECTDATRLLCGICFGLGMFFLIYALAQKPTALEEAYENASLTYLVCG